MQNGNGSKNSQDNDLMKKIVSLSAKRGFFVPSSEIYGGMNGCWDSLALGTALKSNIRAAWLLEVVKKRDDVVEIDTPLLLNPRVWEASGHVDHFEDPMVDCRSCKKRFRTDAVDDVCPDCGGEFTEARQFNLMYKTFTGPVEDSSAEAWLRPETAQGIFINYTRVQTTSRMRPPFGIAQTGISCRNEITPQKFTFRQRWFEQAEVEFFVPPGEDDAWFEFWQNQRYGWYLDLGIKSENLRLRPHREDELAHYAKACVDVEYFFPWGWGELEGIANRRDFDLSRHAEFSGKRLDYYDEVLKKRYVPYVIEPSAGVDRAALAFLIDAYEEEEDRTVLRFHPRLAPVKAAVFPLLKKAGQPERARRIYDDLKGYFDVQYDQTGAVGRRYRRQDEIGTPFCITVDHQTANDGSVTVRERDSMEQERVSENQIVALLDERIWGKKCGGGR